jgi:predicted permease
MALRHLDAGFDASGVMTMRVALPAARYKSTAEILSFNARVLERLRALPGVETAAAIDDLPVQGGSVQPIVLEGRPELLPRDQPTVEVRKVTRDYLRTMRIPILRGRDVADSDREVLLVSRSAAKLLWGVVDPVGRRVTLPLEARGVFKDVIGITGDVKQGNLTDPAAPTVYEFTHQEKNWGSLAFVMRTSVPPERLAQAAVGAIHAIDPDQAVQDVKTMETVVNETLTSQRFTALLLSVFAAAALLLASVGIYSVLSYIVRGRSREIGIRSALGAGTGDVLRLVIKEGLVPTSIGIGAGLAAALAAGKLLQKLVFGVSAWDPLTLGGVALVLLGVSLAASVVPAWRASRLDPLIVLRT